MKFALILLSIPISTQAIESRTKIAVIDTGVNRDVAQFKYMCEDGVKNFTTSKDEDINGHGSLIVNIIGSLIDSKKYCIVSYKVFDDKGVSTNNDASNSALSSIVKDGSYKYVNISMNGTLHDTTEFKLINYLTNKGVKFTIAAGNESKQITKGNCDQYPACYKLLVDKPQNYYVVGAINASYSNYGSVVDVQVEGTISSLGIIKRGTSQAAASYAATIINSDDMSENRHYKKL